MHQILTCIALPAPDSMRQGLLPDPDALVAVPPALVRGQDAEPTLAPPALADSLASSPLFRPDAALRGMDMGAWRGRALKDLPPTDLSRWVADPDFAPPDGQSRTDHLRQMQAWLAALPSTPARLRVLADAAVVRAIVVAALGGTAAMLARLDIAPSTTTRLTRHAEWRVAVAGAPLS
ncbi:histidine phosphatase family protein [Komagataeibacter sp. FNDCF1]|uniref:histidine phosphatase family protein n=1 Tax=Komagataeibacter sp. FNDCF1 TaxID=2878681 RepID=UPI001E64A292|nr:histidine phosphatase family protein [Komagataeibacter sp. FNDCF1]MCE2565541.1 histidine phosphatase family protein [Komagataeibacter sp. FNDCF1]